MTSLARRGDSTCYWYDTARVRCIAETSYAGSQALLLKPPVTRLTLPLAGKTAERLDLISLDERCAALEKSLGVPSGACPDLETSLRRLENHTAHFRAESTSIAPLLSELLTELDRLMGDEDKIRQRPNKMHWATMRNLRRYTDLVAPATHLDAVLGDVATTVVPLETVLEGAVGERPDVNRLEARVDALEAKLHAQWAETLAQIDTLEAAVFSRRPIA